MPKLFWIELAVFVLGEAALLFIIGATYLGLWPDPNPNPVGSDLLSFVTFWLGLALMFIGLSSAAAAPRATRSACITVGRA